MRLAALFHRLGPYHLARLAAAARAGRGELVAVEAFGEDPACPWAAPQVDPGLEIVRAFPGRDAAGTGPAELSAGISRALEAARPDVVAIAGYSAPFALAALRWCVAGDRPRVLFSESNEHDRPRAWWREAVKTRLVRLFQAAQVSGVSQGTYLEKLGMPRERMWPGYNVVDNAHFLSGADSARARAGALREELGLPERFFLSVFRFIPEKNIPGLLGACARYAALAGGAAWPLVMVGDGPLVPLAERLARELDLGGGAIFAGAKGYDELPALYGLASAFVLPSVSETWGLVANEAMAAGLPVLVSNRCGCAAELVREGRNGWTFDPHDPDALASLMLRLSGLSDAEREAMGCASREIISRWTPEYFAENLWNAAEAAARAPRARAGLLGGVLLRALARR